MKTSQSRTIAATTLETDIEPGTPEEAYQAINRAKMLWSFRKRDVDSWSEVIQRWATEPKAWKRIPEMKPYGTAKRMIEAEVCDNYEAFYTFVEAVLGTEWAMKLADNYADRPGPAEGTVNNPNRDKSGKFSNSLHNGYVRNHYGESEAKPERGNTKTYLSERIAKEFPEAAPCIGKGKQYKTVTEAARKLGIVKDRPRATIYIDDPEDAGRYLSSRVDNEWMIAMYDAYMKAQEKTNETI